MQYAKRNRTEAMEGFITLDRKLLEWEWRDDPLMGWLWVQLLLLANWKPVKYHGTEIERGQLLTTVKELSEATGLSVKQTRTRLERLREEKAINIKTANKFSIITICKYDDYQTQEDVEGKQRANKGQTKGKQDKNEKESTKEKDKIKNNENNNSAHAHTHEEVLSRSKEVVGRYDAVSEDSVPELTSGWIETVQRMIYQNYMTMISTEEVLKQYEDFKSQKVDPFLLTTHQDWWQHFKNFCLKRFNQQNNAEDKYSKRKATEVSIKNSNVSEGTF